MNKFKNKNLLQAKINKNDEFYTKYEDIENEIKFYKNCLKDKVIYCNCDDENSNFWLYFSNNFKELGLKKLIATHIDLNSNSYKLEYNGCNIIKTDLKQNGDIFSDECINILINSDIIITNEPFSLWRDYFQLLIKYNKKFLIIGNMNAIIYADTFKKIKENKIWLGVTSPKEFVRPNGSIKKFGNICWFTNLKNGKKNNYIDNHIDYELHKDDYFKYHNYDAIEVSKINKIPNNYNGVMGVPITFLSKYNPDQFEIIGLTSSKYTMPIPVVFGKQFIKDYREQGGTGHFSENMYGVGYYNKEGKAKIGYSRILIKRLY